MIQIQLFTDVMVPYSCLNCESRMPTAMLKCQFINYQLQSAGTCCASCLRAIWQALLPDIDIEELISLRPELRAQIPVEVVDITPAGQWFIEHMDRMPSDERADLEEFIHSVQPADFE